MIKNTLLVASAISAFFLSSLTFAEEPYIGLGAVQHTYKDDVFGNEIEAEPTSYRLTLGSRISKNYIIEAFYLSPNEEDDEVEAPGPTPLAIEYEMIVGASINRAFVTGPLTLYLGPNVTAAKVTVENANTGLNAINEKDTRVSPGFGIGLDLRFYKKLSLNVNAQSYYYSSDILGTGVGAELRYHL